jgi:hypothetical protein
MGKDMAKVKMQLLQTMVVPGVEVRDAGSIHEFNKDDVEALTRLGIAIPVPDGEHDHDHVGEDHSKPVRKTRGNR